MKNIKRLLGVLAISLWMWIIYSISKSPVPFIEQATYCMASTMATFALLSMAYKLLDNWDINKSS